jgi:hypothetical protein
MFNKGQTKEAVAFFDTALQQFRAAKDGRASMMCLQVRGCLPDSSRNTLLHEHRLARSHARRCAGSVLQRP